MSTTGQKVIWLTNMMTIAEIGIDNGPYKNTKPELNVRKVKTLHTLENVCHCGENQVINKIFEREQSEGYGCAWGDSSKLIPITDAEEAELISEEARIKAKRETAQAAKDESEEKHYKQLIERGLCPKCGTFCYGDCSF